VVWTEPWIDLLPFAGQSVQLAFHFHSNSDDNVGRGWYIDDVEIETGPIEPFPLNAPEGFESGLGNWSVDNGTWEVGKPAWGPGAAYRGTNSAATILRVTAGKYQPDTDSRLISPEFTIPCLGSTPRLHFAHWYDIAPGDLGTVEARVIGDSWQTILGPFSGKSTDWAEADADLSAFVGKRVQVAFRFASNSDNVAGAGWYVDEIEVQASLLQAADQVSILEGALFTYNLGSPCPNLQFSLGPGAPDGVQINPESGLLAWVPSESQGPGVYPIQICVSDMNQPSAPVQCVTLTATVAEVNSPPVIDPIGPQVIAANVPLQFSVTAADSDLPPQTLTYSLGEGAPFGAVIGSNTGLFSWTPTPTQATAQFTITVLVTDNGNPPSSASATFVAAPAGGVTGVQLDVSRITPELIRICVRGGTAGAVYNLETTTDARLNPASWSPLQQIGSGDNGCDITHSTINSNRFYRVRQSP
jgi:hypothetical protein